MIRRPAARRIHLDLRVSARRIRCSRAGRRNTPSGKKSPWTPDDIVFSEMAGQFRISPNGKWAIWIKNTGSKDKDHRVSNLFLSSLTEKTEIQMTRGEDEVSNPRWSPSGDTVSLVNRTRVEI